MGMRSGKAVFVLVAVGLVLASLSCVQAASSIDPVAYAAPGPGGVVNAENAVTYYYDDTRFEAWVSIGALQGVRPGAEVAFYRDSGAAARGDSVATGKAITVRDVDCIVKPAPGTAGGAIRPGDVVRVVSNGSRKATDDALASKRHEEDLLTAVISVALTTLIWVAS